MQTPPQTPPRTPPPTPVTLQRAPSKPFPKTPPVFPLWKPKIPEGNILSNIGTFYLQQYDWFNNVPTAYKHLYVSFGNGIITDAPVTPAKVTTCHCPICIEMGQNELDFSKNEEPSVLAWGDLFFD